MVSPRDTPGGKKSWVHHFRHRHQSIRICCRTRHHQPIRQIYREALWVGGFFLFFFNGKEVGVFWAHSSYKLLHAASFTQRLDESRGERWAETHRSRRFLTGNEGAGRTPWKLRGNFSHQSRTQKEKKKSSDHQFLAHVKKGVEGNPSVVQQHRVWNQQRWGWTSPLAGYSAAG